MTSRSRIAGAMLACLILAALALAGPARAERVYGLDEDPIRLGNKALEQGRLADAKTQFERAILDEYQVLRARRGLAVVAYRQGRLSDAESVYREVIAASLAQDKREDPAARAGLGLVLLRLERPAEAAPEFEKALASDPNNWDAQYGRARLLLAQGQLEPAKELLDKGAKKRGVAQGEDNYHYGMALYLLEKGISKEAENEALRALNLDSSDPQRAVLVSRIYAQRGTPAMATTALEQALQAPGMVPTAPLLDELGRLYQQQERWEDARAGYLAAVNADSSYAPALRDLADLLRMAKQHDRAARVYLRYLQLEPGDLDAQAGLVESCVEIGEYGKALEVARGALAADSTRANVRLAWARASLHDPDRAARAAAARLFASLAPDSTWTARDCLAMAEQQRESRDFDAARATLARAAALAPELPDVPFQLGMVELGAGQPAEASALLERAVALKPDAPAYRMNLGIAYLGQRRTADAVASLRQAVALNDRFTAARLLLAQALAASDSVGAAAAEYQKIVDAEPKNAKALRGLAWCRLLKAQYADAAQLYHVAIEAEPDNVDGWAGLGNASLGAGDLDAAQRALEKARSIDPENVAVKKGFELLQRARKGAKGEG